LQRRNVEIDSSCTYAAVTLCVLTFIDNIVLSFFDSNSLKNDSYRGTKDSRSADAYNQHDIILLHRHHSHCRLQLTALPAVVKLLCYSRPSHHFIIILAIVDSQIVLRWLSIIIVSMNFTRIVVFTEV